MMKNKKLTAVILAALVLVMVCAAVLHLTGRQKSSENALQIEWNGKTALIPLEQIAAGPVSGTLINGKGEERRIAGNGILLSRLMDAQKITVKDTVTVVADDEYRATVTVQEISQSGKVYLLLDEDGRLQLVVFGDSNSKRNVNNVIRVIVE